MFVPVIDQNNQPLMPTINSRARRWIETNKATPFWKKGVFCVRLNLKPSNTKKQDIAIGIDPGSKREAYTIKSKAHTYLNVLTGTPDWVKYAMTKRSIIRQNRRHRKTRCRKTRFNNRKKNKLAPSTKSRWQMKLRICSWLKKMYPISCFIVEDIKTKSSKKWGAIFSPLQVGKQWFYQELSNLGQLETRRGWETKILRNQLGLKKSSSKLADKFECHNVDSWVLANSITGGHVYPENKVLLKLMPLRFHRRQLHYLQPEKGGERKHYGGTRSLGFKRGSLVKHKKYGLCYVGGYSKDRISLLDLSSGKRICRTAKIDDCQFKTYLSWRKGK